MAPDKTESTDGPDGVKQDRRTFITTLACLGATALGAGGASAAPVLARSGQLSTAARLRRSSAALTLQEAPVVQRLTGALKYDPPPPPPQGTLGEPPLPSTRQRLLQSLFASPGGGLNASALKLTRGANGIWGHSVPLTRVMSNNPLAGAYAAGITLTPHGCEYASGAAYQSLSGREPVTFYTHQGAIDPVTWGKSLRLLTAELDEFFNSFFTVLFATPGAWGQRLTYALELSMEPYDANFDVFMISRGPAGTSYESAAVSFVATSDGTHIALVELPGSDGVEGYSHTLGFRRGKAVPLFTTFNWLNVVSL